MTAAGPDSSDPSALGPDSLRRVESHFQASDGTRLFRRSWLPEHPRRAVALVHGYAEHSGRYEALGSWLAARGCAVHAYDHRGHGRSRGRRCHVRSFDELTADLGRHLDQVQEEHPELPVTLLGHSMGGLVVLAFLVDCRPKVASAIVSGPALAVDASGIRWRLAPLVARLFPTLTAPSGLDLDGLSRDPEVVRRYLEDPLVERRATASFGVALTRAAQSTATRGAEVQVPLLLMHGEEDSLCAPEGSRRFYADVASSGSALRIYPGLRHEIFNEPERAEVYADLFAWLEEL